MVALRKLRTEFALDAIERHIAIGAGDPANMSPAYLKKLKAQSESLRIFLATGTGG